MTESEQELAFALLAGNWTLQSNSSIVVDGQDITLNFPGFALSFTRGGYTTTNAGDLFSPTGTWTWDDVSAGSLTLDDGKVVTINTLDLSTFKFSFSFAGTGGVANGIGGNYVITIEK